MASHYPNSGITVQTSRTHFSLTNEPRRYPAPFRSHLPSIKTTAGMMIRYSLGPFPKEWGIPLLVGDREQDDVLHNPDPRRDRQNDRRGTIFTRRGFANVGSLFLLTLGILGLFVAFPVVTTFTRTNPSNQGGFNIGGINATGQVPVIPGNYGLVDRDTPQSVRTKRSYTDPNKNMVLVFSDEFNVDGRTFYPGDDPYWEAVDLHYWGTNNLEWYDPSAATTANGSLQLTLSRVDPITNHNMRFRSGMVQTWNKFCFTGGILEASVRLPGASNIAGLWPAIWAMGNLGRAGHGGSLDGTWPYTYDSCDVGTLPNQTYPGTATPLAAVTNGDPVQGGILSYLPGQRLSACTCPGEVHPGPIRPDGSYVGRAAPEIDVFEATVEHGVGKVSLSSQWAPYNANYSWPARPEDITLYDVEGSVINTYKGGVYQQTTSVVAETNQGCYELSEEACFAIYAFEYRPGFDKAYIAWVNDGALSWILRSEAMGADPLTEIGARPIPMEPMYIIANLGFSYNFGPIDFDNLVFPTTMSVDWIRVYQPEDEVNIGCDPVDFPTSNYINRYPHLYTNPNISTWEQGGEPWPRNRLQGGC
ncbi:beta-glucan synthesis-associated protein KRE6 [Coprinopsis cinerea AmutBmut pab1-1]|nr:beta-glucan synthesis-associated protein KRE6 [Coprinopsis cinerea AmutBmut pab1-1]